MRRKLTIALLLMMNSVLNQIDELKLQRIVQKEEKGIKFMTEREKIELYKKFLAKLLIKAHQLTRNCAPHAHTNLPDGN